MMFDDVLYDDVLSCRRALTASRMGITPSTQPAITFFFSVYIDLSSAVRGVKSSYSLKRQIALSFKKKNIDIRSNIDKSHRK